MRNSAIAVSVVALAAGVSLSACGDPVTQRQMVNVVADRQVTPGAHVFISGFNSELDLNGMTRTEISFHENCYEPATTGRWFCNATVTYGPRFYAFAGYLDNPGDGDLASLQNAGAKLHVLTIGAADPGGPTPVYKMELTLIPSGTG